MKTNSEILLVEDNVYDAELTVRALKTTLSDFGLNHVKDGEEALDFIFSRGKFAERDETPPKIIFLDIKLPKVNGLEVLKELKANVETRKIPVIIFTSSKEISDIEECYNLGVNSYIVKPLNFEAFTETICFAGKYWIKINQSI